MQGAISAAPQDLYPCFQVKYEGLHNSCPAWQAQKSARLQNAFMGEQ